MAREAGERSRLERWLHRLGYASAWIEDMLAAAREAAQEHAHQAAELVGKWTDELGDEIEEHDLEASAGSTAATAAAGMIAAQLLRPRPVNWPRAVLAGTIGTLLYDAETIVESRLAARKFGTTPAGRSAEWDDALPGIVARYAAGIGMASFYARYLYGRLPGPPLVQGLTFGALESAARGWGGALTLLSRLSPEVRLPSGYTAIARGTETPLQALRRHLAFGIGLGMVYRDKK